MLDRETVVIVAAGDAWPFYRLCGGYVCQPKRSFHQAGRMGFYSRRQIHGIAALIERVLPSVTLSQAEAARRSLSIDPVQRRIGDIMTAALADARDDQIVQVVVLSPARAPDTVNFDPIVHEGTHAWTQNQRYVRLGALLSASTTHDLQTLGTEHLKSPEATA